MVEGAPCCAHLMHQGSACAMEDMRHGHAQNPPTLAWLADLARLLSLRHPEHHSMPARSRGGGNELLIGLAGTECLHHPCRHPTHLAATFCLLIRGAATAERPKAECSIIAAGLLEPKPLVFSP